MTNIESAKTLKDLYSKETTQKRFYTGGGVIQITSDAKYIISQCDDYVAVLNTETGKVEQTLNTDNDPKVKCLVLSPDDAVLVVAYDEQLLKIWNWRSGLVNKSWKGLHTGPILVMAIDPSSTLLATGSMDTTVKIWDVEKCYYTHNLRGHKGMITAMLFHKELKLFTAALDLHIRLWDLQTSECLWVADGHYSQITTLAFDPTNTDILVSSGRDSVLLVWDIVRCVRTETVAVFEAVEEIVVIRGARPEIGVNANDLHVITAGNKGLVRVWNVRSKTLVHSCEATPGASTHAGQLSERSLSRLKRVAVLGQICASDRDGNIRFYDENTLKVVKQYMGDNDDIYGVALFGANEEFLAMATNSSSVRIYQLDNFDSEQLHGHEQIVMSVSVSCDGQLLLTGAKDSTAILWKLGNGIHDIHMVYRTPMGEKAVTATTFSCKNNMFMLTGGLDATLKVWRASGGRELSEPSVTITCSTSISAHDRQIEYIDVAPNSKLIVTASQDKTAKVWTTASLSLTAVLKGHTRAVTCAKFSPIDQCVITSSDDGTIKIFALSNHSCIKTFQGHEHAVLNLCFVSRGMQFVSSDDAGLIKLWTIKENECVETFDAHKGSCWALTCSKDGEKRMVTGGGDSELHIWKDMTVAKKQAAQEKQNKEMKRGQRLSNLIHEKRYHEALCLALTMEKPLHSLNIIHAILKNEGEPGLYDTVEKLNLSQTGCLLRFCMLWNTNSKTCHDAQLLINQVLRINSHDMILQLPNLKSILEGTLPYTERHYHRMNQLVQSSQFVDYTWNCLKLGDLKLEPDGEEDYDRKISGQTEEFSETDSQDEGLGTDPPVEFDSDES